MIANRHAPQLRVLAGGGEHRPGRSSLRVAGTAAPSSLMDAPTDLTIECTDSNGDTTDFAAAVRAVYAGAAKPEAFSVALTPAVARSYSK